MNNVLDCWYGPSFAWIEYVMKVKAKLIRSIFEEKASIFFMLLYISIGTWVDEGK
jgi:hypothetical protein